MHSWESRTKFEATFVGHTWVARLASDMDIVVDTYTVEPLVVRDCPTLTNQIQIGLHNTAEVNGIGEVQRIPVNATGYAVPSNATAAATDGTQPANVHSM